jgi:adenylate cyclase
VTNLKRIQLRALAITCAVCTGALLLLMSFSTRYRNLEWATRDSLSRHGKRSTARPEVVFLAIDNATVTLDLLLGDEIERSPALQKMQAGFPFPRDVYPLIIERLAQAGAKVIALDMLFPAERDADPPFREALEKHADKVVIGANLEQRDQGARAGEERIRHTMVPPAGSLIPPPEHGLDARVGYVNFWPDADGIVRRALYRTTLEELEGLPTAEHPTPLPSLAARILEKLGRNDLVPGKHQPVLFRYAQAARPFSLYEIFVDRFWDGPIYQRGEMFRGKLVVIGPDGNWIKDEVPTPFGMMLGPRLHLSALSAALAGDFLRETTPTENAFAVVVCGAFAWLLGRFVKNPMRRLQALLAVTLAFYGAAQLLFNYAGLFPIVLSPLLALVGSAGAFSIVEQWLDRIEKARLRHTFERYVSKDVVKELVDNPEGWLNTLGGQRKLITVLFSDVRGFTTLTESADEHALVAQLNQYFEEMVNIVFAHRGTLDKFIGDAVMAQWGGIDSAGPAEDARRAVAAALEMRAALKKLNPVWRARGMPELQFGIGINHGPAIVGNLGAEVKKEVTAIGDAVNTASRLEGVTKQYQIDLCIGEAVAALVHDAFILRSLDLILVKGKTKPLEIFAVLDKRAAGVAEPPWLARHEEAERLYRAGDFANAERAWRDVLAQAPDDAVSQVFIERCVELQQHPPEGAWSGVFEMKSK